MNAADYQAPRLLRNPHVQSVLASSGVRRLLYRRRLSRLERGATGHVLDCGDGVRLLGLHTPQRVMDHPRGLVVLLHGWEGSVQSSYVLHTGSRLLADGYDVFRLNFRDHGDTHHLNPELFHSCRIDEVVGAVGAVARMFHDLPLGIAGFSLGGNFALRVALRAPDAGIPLAYALAVCPAISPRDAMDAIEQGPWFYEAYFLRKWRRSLVLKQRAFPQPALFSADDMRGNLRALTRALVLKHTGFKSVEDYFDGYSIAGNRLAAMRVPTTILTSADDPIIPVADFRQLTLPPCVELEIAPAGGHCGFIQGLSLTSWTEDYIAHRMLRNLPAPE
ncbi:alpha/beta fold hydrolase [Dokdonella sp.]|uniref:YheT family hydrolase n=1 Tax=Dokdonella sp. TaxID=2291710 RepID=UPI002C43D664|nr:alpha/beta fold hydrolase [Dokdonella sp.]HOX71163.1 alpha/beta fold hydrolase [Dokdonella sp.]HPN78759.1 alpha/beta fold hydrolase [Dokdonella sp.]